MHTAEFLRGATPVLEPAVLAAGRLPGPRAQPAERQSLAQRYRSSGGHIGCDDLMLLLDDRREQPISLLARWIVDRRVIHFQNDGQLVLPLFQFEFPGLSVLPAVAEAIAELGDCFDDGQMTEWFAMPSGWLQGALPAEAMALQPAAVLQAARADRFALLG